MPSILNYFVTAFSFWHIAISGISSAKILGSELILMISIWNQKDFLQKYDVSKCFKICPELSKNITIHFNWIELFAMLQLNSLRVKFLGVCFVKGGS